MLFYYFLAGLFIIFLLATTIYAAVIGAPFAGTPKQGIRKSFKLIDLKPNEKVYDLGAGDGRVLIIAAKEFGVQSYGFELSFLLYLFAKINIFLSGVSKKAKVKWTNFFKEDLSGADVIFCWLTPKTLPKLEYKFKNELKTGTRVIVFSSPLNFWSVEKEFEVNFEGIKIFGISFIPTSKVKTFIYRKI